MYSNTTLQTMIFHYVYKCSSFRFMYQMYLCEYLFLYPNQKYVPTIHYYSGRSSRDWTIVNKYLISCFYWFRFFFSLMYFYIIFLDSEPGESLSLFLLLRVISDIFIIFFFLNAPANNFSTRNLCSTINIRDRVRGSKFFQVVHFLIFCATTRFDVFTKRIAAF